MPSSDRRCLSMCPHAATAAKGCLILCTVLGLTLNLSATPRMVSPAFRAARIRASKSGAIRGRPSCLPSALALLITHMQTNTQKVAILLMWPWGICEGFFRTPQRGPTATCNVRLTARSDLSSCCATRFVSCGCQSAKLQLRAIEVEPKPGGSPCR